MGHHLAAILSGFDTRLAKLEKAILPLYNSTQLLTRRGNRKSFVYSLLLQTYKLVDIESALQKMDEIASNQEGIAAEEALILRG